MSSPELDYIIRDRDPLNKYILEKDKKQMNEIRMIQENRVTVSRERTINLGKYNLPYETEKIFVSANGDTSEGIHLLNNTAAILLEETAKIEAKYANKDLKGS